MMVWPVILPSGWAMEMHESRSEHVFRASEDRNNFRRLLRGANRVIADAHDQVDPLFDNIGSVASKLFRAQSVAVRIAHEVLALDKTVPPHLFKKRVCSLRVSRSSSQDAESIDSTRLLRPRRARPSDTETHKDDEVAPSHGVPKRPLT